MSGNPPPAIMTSPVFRYAVLVVLSVVVVMGAGVCYRTRVYQRRMGTLAGPNTMPVRIVPTVAIRDWGPKPKLFDVYLHAPREKPESDWDEMMPVSVARGALDASGTSSLARIFIIISMPFSEPFMAEDPVPDDERHLPHLEMGLSEVAVLLTDPKALRSSSESDQLTSKKDG
ncbi:hypothetical protein B0H19DRAFT_1141165 [Mycena capillaripes]|nr:hypothetical protein B0H19DRAFT_1141165 [Mycena capillaripes]